MAENCRIEKLKVATGVYWIEVPEADFRMVCGCPADTVKHLIKKGFILRKQSNGSSFETGPNAILLSDVPVQNGQFSNLSEFPVLQMFYRQGMLIPEHPNNTGRKPMLIGVRHQVEAQAEYIFRGNYGLVSAEEITAAGVDPETAERMMRLKLRFAFDRIKPTEELLDLRTVDHGSVELDGGVVVARLGLNNYEVSYGGEAVRVDLNLERGERYEPALHLGFHKAVREYFSVIHIGDGDGWDVNRPCMASLISFQGRFYLIDAGPNIHCSLTAMGISINEIDGVFHTHAHDDHFAGMTTLVRANHKIKYYATELVRHSVMKKFAALTGAEEDLFADYFDIRDIEFDAWNNIDGLEVMPVFSPHPVETSILFFRALSSGGYRRYAHLADTASFATLESMVVDDPARNGISRRWLDEVKQQYLAPADIKKIDIGGGLIHGAAADFKQDRSRIILLSHTERELTDEEKEIGSNADFGMQDTLIPAQADYCVRKAREYLVNYFPGTPASEIDMLLNSPIVELNAGSILMRGGAPNETIYLILGGVVEFIESEYGVNHTVTAAAVIGELSGILGLNANGTYRTASYVKALAVPSSLYVEFVKRNELYEEIKKLHVRREFLTSTWLFGEMVSYPVQNRIAQGMSLSGFGESEPAVMDPDTLYMVADGELELHSSGQVIETLGPGGFFGEESVLHGINSFFQAKALTAVTVYAMSGDVLKGIPIANWKLRETFDRRLNSFSVMLG